MNGPGWKASPRNHHSTKDSEVVGLAASIYFVLRAEKDSSPLALGINSSSTR